MKIQGWIRRGAEFFSGMKLRYRMFLVYIFGGALPIALIGIFLVKGNAEILIRQAEEREKTEMELIVRQVSDLTETVDIVSRQFYFDSKLEEIAQKEYVRYKDMVDDFREYTDFMTYSRYYDSIEWINVYMDNQTLKGNARFVRLTDELRSSEWYRSVSEKKGKSVWRYRKIPASRGSALCSHRFLRTKKGGAVGALAVYVKPERLSELLQERTQDCFIVLNSDTVISETQKELDGENILQILPGSDSELVQKNIFIGEKEYVMTCRTHRMRDSDDYLQVVSFRSYQNILSEVIRQSRTGIWLFAVSIVFAATMIMLYTRSYSNRVECFLEQMKKVASGNFELEEKLGGRDEIGILYDYLGTMIYQIQKLLAEIYRERIHAEQLKTCQKDVEFKMLASQINPHFLYNTLETIRMKARRSGQEEIEELVKMLAKILRSSLKAGSSDVTLASELELVRCYLKIQQSRFGDRIQYEISAQEGLDEYMLMPLLLQPIVENSIIHGLEGKEGTGSVRLTACRRDGHVVITVFDNGLGMSEEKLEKLRNSLNVYKEDGRHIGIGNVHQRVRLRYGSEFGLTVDSCEGCWTKVEILLPGDWQTGTAVPREMAGGKQNV